MSTIRLIQFPCWCSLAVCSLSLGGLSAQAETVKADGSQATAIKTIAHAQPASLAKAQPTTTPPLQPKSSTSTTDVALGAIAPGSTSTPLPGTALTSATELNAASADGTGVTIAQTNSTTPSTTAPSNPGSTTTPETTSPSTTTPSTTTPGTTSPTDTTPSTTPGTTTTPETPSSSPSGSPGSTEVSPGRATRSGSSYVGIGGNIGLGSGDTALGRGSFVILSKIGLTSMFSVRPSLLIRDSVTILLPITYDFSFGEGPTSGLGFRAAPYLGIGPAISTKDGARVDLLLTGGVDIPISSQFTATAAVNATVTGRAAVGLMLGIGYNFSGF